MASRNNSTARNEIIEELKADHQRVKKNFRDAQKLDSQEDGEELRAIVEQACAALDIHTRLEEELFYPAARGVIKEGDLIDEAEVEHGSAKALIAQLRDMSPDDEKYQPMFKVLGECIKHHVKEEETEMFPAVQGRSSVQWEQVQQQMQTMREQLMPEMGLAEDEEGEKEEAVGAADAQSKSRSAPTLGTRSSPSRRRGGGESRPQASDKQEESND